MNTKLHKLLSLCLLSILAIFTAFIQSILIESKIVKEYFTPSRHHIYLMKSQNKLMMLSDR